MAISTASLLFTGGLGATAATLTAGQMLVGGLVFMGASSVVSSALVPKPSIPSFGNVGSNMSVSSDPVGNAEIVYGQIRKGGTKVYHETTGDGKYYHYFLALAMHEVEEIGNIYINDEVATLDGSGFVTSQDWNSKILIKKFTGSSTQNIYSSLSGLSNGPSNYTSTFKGQGVAVLYVRLEYEQKTFASGMPMITAVVKGKKLYDPRKDSTSSAYDSSLGVSTHRTNDASTWQYSNNPALVIRDYLTSNLGVGADQDQIDDDMIATAVNDCATQSGSFNESTNSWNNDVTVEDNSFETDGSLSTGNSKLANLNTLIKCLNGTLFWAQGQFRLVAGGYRNPEVTDAFTLDDVRSPISIQTRSSRRDLINTVRGTFVDRDNRWIAGEFPQVQAVDMSEDNNIESVIDLDFPMCTKSAAVQRLAKQVLYTSREQITLKARFSSKAFQLQVGDRIKLTISRYGWTNKLFLVKGWKVIANNGGPIEVELELQETSSTAYRWSLSAEEYAEITANNISLDNIADNLAISTPTVSQVTRVQSDGTVLASAAISWTAPSNGQVVEYEVFYGPTAGGLTTLKTAATSVRLPDLEAGAEFVVRVYAITSRGTVTPFASRGEVTFTVSSDTTAPSIPASPSATANDDGTITVTWTAVTDNDLKQYLIYRGTSTNPTTLIGASGTNIFVDNNNLSPRTTYYYRVTAIDHTGNESSYSDNTDAEAVAGIPVFAELEVGDPYFITQSGGTSNSYANNMGTLGQGDFWFLRRTSGSNLIPTFSSGSVSFNNGYTYGYSTPYQPYTYVVDVLVIQSPTEKTNTDAEYDALNTIKVGSQIMYTAEEAAHQFGTEQIVMRVDTLYPVQISGSYKYYFFGVTRIAGQASFNSNTQSGFFYLNYQLKGDDGVSGERGAGRWNVSMGTSTATALTTGRQYIIKTVGTSDFTLAGAGANTVGTKFTATGTTTGTGTVNLVPNSSSEVASLFVTNVGAAVEDDQVWLYAGTETDQLGQSVWIYNGSSWTEQNEVIDGSLLVTGTVTADALAANSVTAAKISISDETQSSRIEVQTNKILIYDTGTLRVKLGDLS